MEQYQHHVRPVEHSIVLENSVTVRRIKMTRTKALCLNFGKMVWLEWSELANEEAILRQANDKMLHLTLNGFKYYVAADDYETFVINQLTMMEVIGC